MTGEPVRTSASLFVEVELGAGGLAPLSAWVASKKEAGTTQEDRPQFPAGEGSFSCMGQAQVQELELWLGWIVESLSNELYSLGWSGSLGNPPASASASGFDCGTLPHPTGFEPRDTSISSAEYLRGRCKLMALKPSIPESQQAGSHSPQAESNLEGACGSLSSTYEGRARVLCRTEFVAASADPHLMSITSQNNSQFLIMV